MAVTALLLAPTLMALNYAVAPVEDRVIGVVATLGLVVAIAACYAIGGSRRGLIWLLPLLACMVLIRLTQLGTVHFSGAGFTTEFFFHLGAESIQVAILEYSQWMWAGAVLLVVLLALTYALARQISLGSVHRWAVFGALGFGVALLGRSALPEWELWQAWRHWSNPMAAIDRGNTDTQEKLIANDLLEIDITYKNQVQASLSAEPKNLIIVYLESVGINLADYPNWPDLMPNLKELNAKHAWVDHLWTSSYITIEGLTNSYCGTLVPFVRGSESIADGDGAVNTLPCLGDVLNTAGYHQVFVGGAEMTFAGKGEFLAQHGFDEVLGLEHWREQGLSSRPNTWGLSDPDLFSESLKIIDQLALQPQPWHLSLLTIGTHLPGYVYEECRPYPNGQSQFLDALHCTDQLLFEWIQALEARGILEDTILVITADHQIFPNHEMKKLFGDGVYDRRLPMIVLGPVEAKPTASTGSGYDLAPTVLDLLQVEHDARFVLGRSLARESQRPDYFFTRYDDFFDGQRISSLPECDGGQGAEFPLDACEKTDLMGMLAWVGERFSRTPSRLNCARDYIQYPTDPSMLAEIIIGGDDQSNRFIRSGRPVDLGRPGWALMFFDGEGEVLSRSFLPSGLDPTDWPESLDGDFQNSTSQILIWTGEDEPFELPWFAPPLELGRHAWWIDKDQNIVAESTAMMDQVLGEVKRLKFNPDLCAQVFNQ